MKLYNKDFFSQGTSNMMALDLLRALSKNNGESYQAFHEFVLEISKNATSKNENPKIVTTGRLNLQVYKNVISIFIYVCK